MPAKTKYLSSPGQRVLKITAGVIGGFLLAMALQLAAAVLLADKAPLIVTSTFLSFFLWVGLMVVAFMFRSGWRVWGLYLGGVALCGGVIYLAS